MDYFIADLHFGHKNIIKLCDRPFSSIEEMDEEFISTWNAKVKKKADTVYIVGDLVWEKAEPLEYITIFTEAINVSLTAASTTLSLEMIIIFASSARYADTTLSSST